MARRKKNRRCTCPPVGMRRVPGERMVLWEPILECEWAVDGESPWWPENPPGCREQRWWCGHGSDPWDPGYGAALLWWRRRGHVHPARSERDIKQGLLSNWCHSLVDRHLRGGWRRSSSLYRWSSQFAERFMAPSICLIWLELMHSHYIFDPSAPAAFACEDSGFWNTSTQVLFVCRFRWI